MCITLASRRFLFPVLGGCETAVVESGVAGVESFADGVESGGGLLISLQFAEMEVWWLAAGAGAGGGG